ncbi:MAG: hypothetical protein LC720_01360, partial [Actinobacteria bacterium]|nr:hypothetical protein [Actinomycetota bacterium]
MEVGPGLDDRLPRDRGSPRVGEGHGQGHERPVQPESLSGVPVGEDLARPVVGRRVEGEALDPHPPLDLVVVGVEVGPGDGPVLVAAPGEILGDEPPLVLAQEDVGVDQRPAAEPRGADGV